jgi:GNAT superfamily N-acetyltransferase
MRPASAGRFDSRAHFPQMHGSPMDTNIDYRWMRPEDGPSLTRLHRRAILLEGVRAYGPDLARSWAHGLKPEGYAAAAAEGEAIEVATIQGAVVGFCGVRDDEIRGLYVDPAYARHGVGAALMRRALQRIQAGGFARARVTAARSGVEFYEAMGFHTERGRMYPTRGGLAMPVLEMTRP